ncbi:hypothetical protein DESUT3_02090 [Desulfuromonas versatilis]|uniref:Uncharacterized protein n=2 Tax=Desulfuromonas versatilis TaxID=2802975 RepID=A0ABM8HNL6_9BACT|nr:hypothetical protein DESUT3_02090 [Desulfuromonas versatilis]
MDPKDLLAIWTAPDHSKLTPRQISLRLPIQVAAKINALCDMYPRKTKTEIIGDLLATALDQLEQSLPSKEGRLMGHDPDTDEPVYEDLGARGVFFDRTQFYLKQYEDEIADKKG